MSKWVKWKSHGCKAAFQTWKTQHLIHISLYNVNKRMRPYTRHIWITIYCLKYIAQPCSLIYVYIIYICVYFICKVMLPPSIHLWALTVPSASKEVITSLPKPAVVSLVSPCGGGTRSEPPHYISMLYIFHIYIIIHSTWAGSLNNSPARGNVTHTYSTTQPFSWQCQTTLEKQNPVCFHTFTLFVENLDLLYNQTRQRMFCDANHSRYL